MQQMIQWNLSIKLQTKYMKQCQTLTILLQIMSKLISVISICYNEELNILECYQKVKELFKNNKLNYEHIFVDNDSNDNTKKIIEDICSKDKNVKGNC